jgi:4'-phosphopantetheinyl transferase
VNIEAVVARLDLCAEGVALLSMTLSEDERSRARRFARERDRRRYVVARGRLRELLAQRLGADPREIELVHGANGKPALAHGSLRFNVSHCEDLALYGFAEGREIGVDLEVLRELSEADQIAERFFSADERAAYRALPAPQRTRGFFRCWTRKEALAKALGTGLAISPERHGGRAWHVESFSPRPGFIAALAVAPA